MRRGGGRATEAHAGGETKQPPWKTGRARPRASAVTNSRWEYVAAGAGGPDPTCPASVRPHPEASRLALSRGGGVRSKAPSRPHRGTTRIPGRRLLCEAPRGTFPAANWVIGGFLRHTRLQPLLPHALAHPPPAYPFCGPHVCRALTVGQAPCQARGGQGERAAGELGAAEAPTTRPPRPQPGDAPGGTSQRRWHPSPS